MSNLLYNMIMPFTFTNMGASGPYGPYNILYSTSTPGYGTSYQLTLGTGTSNGMQLWTVPQTTSYNITIAGAGNSYKYINTYGFSVNYKSYGIIGQTTFNLKKGDIIQILIGQQGTVSGSSLNNVLGGGNGGTFMYNQTSNILLCVAGGAGGNANDITNHTIGDGTGINPYTNGNGIGRNAESNTSGSSGNNYDYYGSGGTNGYGGSASTSGYGGQGGAGYRGNGGINDIKECNSVAASSFLNGGIGGYGSSAPGGFGGGGDGGYITGAGGGGGYSGGGGGPQVYFGTGGGGGGSYTSNTWNYIYAGNLGNGYLTIDYNTQLNNQNPVTNITIPTIQGTYVVINFTPSLGGAEYHIVSNPPTTTQITNSSNYTFNGLTINTTYSFTITSYYQNIIIGVATSSIIHTSSGVSMVSLNNITASSLQIYFTPDPIASSYSITSIPSTTTQVTTYSGYTFSNLNPNTLYNFNITSINANNEISGSVIIGPYQTGPDAVTNLTQGTTTFTNIQINFTPASGASYYSINTSPTTSTQLAYMSGYSFSNLSAGTSYTFYVNSVGLNNTSGNTATAYFSTAPLASQFGNCSPSSNYIIIEYKIVNAAVKYSISMVNQTNISPTLTQIAIPQQPYIFYGSSPYGSYTFSNLQPSNQYFATITSIGANNSIGGSTSTTIITQDLPPTNITAGTITSTSIELQFIPGGPNTNYYTITTFPSPSTNHGSLYIPYNPAGVSYIYTGLSPNTTYTFTILGYSGGGSSALVPGTSATATFTTSS